LGDLFFYGDTVVTFEVRCHKWRFRSRINEGFHVVKVVEEHWKPGKRAIDIKILCSMKDLPCGSNVSIYVHVSVDATIIDALDFGGLTTEELIKDNLKGLDSTVFDDCKDTISMRCPDMRFVPISSDLIEIPQSLHKLPLKTERIALRTLQDVILYEELSGSIARHVWDAGSFVVNLPERQLVKFIWEELKPSSKPNILELGTGIGLVSIHLSKLLPNAHINATDLPDALEICEMNIGLNYSSVTFDELDWESENSTGIHWDLVVTTDCTYNPLYYDSLLHVLHRESNPGTMVLLVHKFREPVSESEFFMKCARFFKLKRQIWYSESNTLIHMGLYTPKSV
jgi:hypothetical protein